MKVKEMIEKIVQDGNRDDMYKLNDMLDELICDLKVSNYEMYEKYKNELYETAYGKVINLEMAEKWVDGMVPRAIWSKEETDGIMKKYNVNLDSIDFYVVMNMLYSDMGSVLGSPEENLESYVRATKDWLSDKDAKDDKLYLYYKYVVK